MPTAAGRRLTGEEDARRCLRAAEGSQLGRRAWAHANGVNARSLNAWRLILGRKSRPAPVLRLVEVVAATVPAAEATYAVRIGELRIEVDRHFDPVVLRRLIAAVSPC